MSDIRAAWSVLCILCKYSTSARVESILKRGNHLAHNLFLHMEINPLCLTKYSFMYIFFCILSDLVNTFVHMKRFLTILTDFYLVKILNLILYGKKLSDHEFAMYISFQIISNVIV